MNEFKTFAEHPFTDMFIKIAIVAGGTILLLYANSHYGLFSKEQSSVTIVNGK